MAADGVPLVLVTGASGFISTNVIHQLLTGGKYRVRGTVRNLKKVETIEALKGLVPNAKHPLELVEADLENKDAWPAIVKGCTYVYHLASPFPLTIPKDPDDLIRPAVAGTTNVLAACAESGTVKKVVLTSSIAAVSCGGLGHPGLSPDYVYSEKDWSPENGCSPYEISKTRAERAAWDFVKDLPPEKKFDLVTVHPAFVQGPPLTKSSGSSIDFLKGFLTGAVDATLNLNLPLVDVRDVARAQIAAMEKPETNGNRYLLVAEGAYHVTKATKLLRDEFEPQGYKIGDKKVSKIAAWFGSFFNSGLKYFYPWIGKSVKYSNTKMVNDLGVKPRPAEETLLDTAYGLIEIGLVEKTAQYRGPKPKN